MSLVSGDLGIKSIVHMIRAIQDCLSQLALIYYMRYERQIPKEKNTNKKIKKAMNRRSLQLSVSKSDVFAPNLSNASLDKASPDKFIFIVSFQRSILGPIQAVCHLASRSRDPGSVEEETG